MRYKRRVTEPVEAVRWTGQNTPDVMRFCGEHADPGSNAQCLTFVPLAFPAPQLWVAANQAWVTVEPGEWFIRDAKGVYPCKPDMFELNYEPVG